MEITLPTLYRIANAGIFPPININVDKIDKRAPTAKQPPNA